MKVMLVEETDERFLNRDNKKEKIVGGKRNEF